MLVDFKVSNFLSFRDEVAFSMVPMESRDDLIATNISNPSQLMRVAAIYGANASGKSNFCKALGRLAYLVSQSFKNSISEKLPFTPYLLNKKNKELPTTFKLSFICEKNLYYYEISYSGDHIKYELLKRIEDKDVVIFERRMEKKTYSLTTDLVKLSSELKEYSSEVIPNRSFLSDLINNKGYKKASFVEAYNGICENINFLTTDFRHKYTLTMLNTESRQAILDCVKSADLSIENIKVPNEEEINKIVEESKVPASVREHLVDNIFLNASQTVHKTEEGDYINFILNSNESDGTQRFLNVIGPIFSILKEGETLCMDELDRGLHPHLVRFIISLFANPKINKNNAQIIFTSFAHYLMDGETLEKDQIWFVAKEDGYASSVYALADFNEDDGKKDFYTSYMYGIYGAVPKIREYNV